MKKPNLINLIFFDRDDKITQKYCAVYPLTSRQKMMIRELENEHYDCHPMGTIKSWYSHIQPSEVD